MRPGAEHRTALVCLRLTEQERARLVGLALSKGVTTSTLLREKINELLKEELKACF